MPYIEATPLRRGKAGKPQYGYNSYDLDRILAQFRREGYTIARIIEAVGMGSKKRTVVL
jgi:hypothetical protein